MFLASVITVSLLGEPPGVVCCKYDDEIVDLMLLFKTAGLEVTDDYIYTTFYFLYMIAPTK
jgi:hypothetical protein